MQLLILLHSLLRKGNGGGPIAERSWINCRFHLIEANLNVDESKQCQGRFRNGKCGIPCNLKYTQYLEADNKRKQKIKGDRVRKKVKTAPEQSEANVVLEFGKEMNIAKKSSFRRL